MEKNMITRPSNEDIEQVWRLMDGDPLNVDYDLAKSVYYNGYINATSNGNKSVWEDITKAANAWSVVDKKPEHKGK